MITRSPGPRPRGKRRRIGAAEFKARCLQLLDHVKHSGEELEITKRGELVAIVSPPRVGQTQIFGLFRGRMEITGDIVHCDTSDEWDAMK
jgi:prevent-host-death family protein